MKRTPRGRYVIVSTVGKDVKAFVPVSLPPSHPIDWTPELRGKFDAALPKLGRLDAVSLYLPDMYLFLYTPARSPLRGFPLCYKGAGSSAASGNIQGVDFPQT